MGHRFLICFGLPLLILASTASASAQDGERRNAEGWGRAGCGVALVASHTAIQVLGANGHAYLEVPPEPEPAGAEIAGNLGLSLLYIAAPVGLCALSYFGVEQAALAGLWDDDLGHGIATGILGATLGFVGVANIAAALGASPEEWGAAAAVSAGVLGILGGLLGGVLLADRASLRDEAQMGAFIFSGGLTVLGGIAGAIVGATTDSRDVGFAIASMAGLVGLGMSTLLLE